MNKKVVGIIMKEKTLDNKELFSIDKYFDNIVKYYDVISIGIINQNSLDNLNNILSVCDGFILQGGTNYSWYEKSVLEYAINTNKPILGICMGMQLMASINKNNLSIIDTNVYNKHDIKKKYVHKIYIDTKSKLYNIIGKSSILVNSTHKEYVTTPGIYKVSSYSSDGIIESIEYNKNKFNIGVQFHPERLFDDENIKKIFDAFINNL